jgi:hypothetical protein
MEAIAVCDAHAARLTTIVAALLLCLGEAGFALLHGDAGGLRGLCFAHAAIAGVIALGLGRHRTVDPRWTLIAFLVLAVPLLPVFWISESLAIAEGGLWQPLIGRKLILLGLALLTPYSPAVAAVLVATFMGESVVLWHYLDLRHNPIAAAAGEPWVTLVYFAATSFLVAQRWRNRRAKEGLLQAQIEAEALRHLTQASLAVRDQVNTPLQALQLGVMLFKKRHPEEQAALDCMSRALHKLNEISRGVGLDARTETEQRTARLRAARQLGAWLERST